MHVFVDPTTSPTLTASLFIDDASELAGIACEVNGPDADARKVSLAEAAAFHGTNVAAICDFLKAGLPGRVNEHLGVDLEDLQAFMERYTLSGEIVKRIGLSWFTLTSTLASAGIQPAREWISGSKVTRRI